MTVALPVHRAGAELDLALADIRGQTLRDLEILIVLNGSDAATARRARACAKSDARVRVLTLREPSLAAALNLALRSATHDLVARMDADDRCAPDRLAKQAAWMAANPGAAAVGTAWEQVDGRGRVVATIRPACAARELAWRIFVDNPLAHGSMMLRHSAVRAVGAYDERLKRAQDYDLWLRLARVAPIGCLPEVLYTHRLRDESGSFSAGAAQARGAAGAMVGAWAGLARLSGKDRDELAGRLARAMSATEAGEGALAPLVTFLNERGPSAEALGAYLWARDRLPSMTRRAVEVSRAARLREVGARIASAGARRVSLWGAGAHAGWIVDHAGDLGVRIEGIVDDALAGETRCGFRVEKPSALGAGAHVLIASDAHEEHIWRASAQARARGVRVWRLYGATHELPGRRRARASASHSR